MKKLNHKPKYNERLMTKQNATTDPYLFRYLLLCCLETSRVYSTNNL